MMKILVVVLALWLKISTCRRLTDTISNDISSSSSNDISFGRPKDWITITAPPKPVYTRPVGSRTELECEAMGSPVPSIQWLKGNSPITENESFETNVLSDLPTSGMAKIRSRLVISPTLSIHEDSYTCIVESGSQVATAKTRLYVNRNGTPEKNFTQLLTEEILGGRQTTRIILYSSIFMDNIGNDIVLPCKAIGNPHPNVIWLDPSEQVLGGGSDPRMTVHPDGELRIRGVRWSDMGPYTCVARNSISQDTITTFLYPMLAEKK